MFQLIYLYIVVASFSLVCGHGFKGGNKEESFIWDVLNKKVEASKGNNLPIVLWHGMGDNCCLPFSMGNIQKMFEADLGVYVKSLMIGQNSVADTANGFLMDVNKQIEFACEELKKDEKLKNGFNAIGFSQGGQFLRAYVQRCNTPKVNNLITFGGQHQGVSHLPHCGSGWLCEMVKRLLSFGAYIPFVQNHVVQAQYWHDENDEANYLKNCKFLPDINNALPVKNATYKKNLMSLNKFVMVKFLNDTMVMPRESEHFEFVDPNDHTKILPLRQSKIYLEDHLGLQAMDKNGQVVFLETIGEHLEMSRTWMQDHVYSYLNGEK